VPGFLPENKTKNYKNVEKQEPFGENRAQLTHIPRSSDDSIFSEKKSARRRWRFQLTFLTSFREKNEIIKRTTLEIYAT
jgi:hypothetical protein